MRLFGVADLTRDPDAFIAEHRLGPDPLDPKFTLRVSARLLARRRGAIKSLLMSQEIIAGIGNLYADETLYQSSIHPRRPVDELSDAEVKTIFTGDAAHPSRSDRTKVASRGLSCAISHPPSRRGSALPALRRHDPADGGLRTDDVLLREASGLKKMRNFQSRTASQNLPNLADGTFASLGYSDLQVELGH